MSSDDYFNSGGRHRHAQHQQQLPLILQSVRRSIVTGGAPLTPPSKKADYVEDDMTPPMIERTYSEASASSTSTSTTNGSPPSSPSRRGANQGNGSGSVLQARAALLLRATLAASLFVTVLYMVRLQTLPAQAFGEHQVRSKGEGDGDGLKVNMLPAAATSSSSLEREPIGQREEVEVKAPPIDVDIDGHKDTDHATFPTKEQQSTTATRGVQPRSFPPRITGAHYTKYRPKKKFTYYYKKEVVTYEHPDLPSEVPNGDRTVQESKYRDTKCKPYAEWHSTSFPTCNGVHEIDFVSGIRARARAYSASPTRFSASIDAAQSASGADRDSSASGSGSSGTGESGVSSTSKDEEKAAASEWVGEDAETSMSYSVGAARDDDDDADDRRILAASSAGEPEHGMRIDYLSKGATREAWKLYPDVGGDGDDGFVGALSRPLVFKNLIFKEEYKEAMYDHQRIDALATERLTSSPYVIDIYAFCGESAINDFGDGGDVRNYYADGADSIPAMRRLELARDAALGLADIHSVGTDEVGSYTPEGGNVTLHSSGAGHAQLVHHDMRMANFLFVDGKLKFHDFNNARLLKYNFNTDEACSLGYGGFCDDDGQKIHPPSECEGYEKKPMMTDKMELYKFGQVLYFLLKGKYPHFQKLLANGNLTDANDPLLKVSVLDSFAYLPHLPDWFGDNVDDGQTEGDQEAAALRILRDAMHRAFIYEEEKRPTSRDLANFLVEATARLTRSSR